MAETIIRDAVAEDEAAWRLLWDGYCEFYKVEIPEATTASTWSRILDRHTLMFCRLAGTRKWGDMGGHCRPARRPRHWPFDRRRTRASQTGSGRPKRRWHPHLRGRGPDGRGEPAGRWADPAQRRHIGHRRPGRRQL